MTETEYIESLLRKNIDQRRRASKFHFYENQMLLKVFQRIQSKKHSINFPILPDPEIKNSFQ